MSVQGDLRERTGGGGRDPSVWPKKLTFQLFQGWFELEWGSEVFDLGRGEIERERMDG